MVEMILLILVMLATIGTNVITLFVVACTDYLRNINRVYLYSMTISDLCIGLFIFPFALYSLIINSLGYPEINEKLCHLQAYTLVVFFLSGLYGIAWMNVDHYVAVRKPERYKVMMSPPRSLCWIGFAWIAAVSFCSPPMLNFKDTRYYTEVFMCTIKIDSEIPYFITAGVLALIPPLLVLVITDVYLFTHGFKKKQKMYEAVMLDVSSRPRNYQMNFLVSIVYFGTWLPWCLIRITSLFEESIPQELHFITFWIAMGNGFYKFFIYAGMSVEYRRGLRDLLRSCCARFKCTCCDRVLPPRQNLTVNLTRTRLVAKPSTSGPPPTIV